MTTPLPMPFQVPVNGVSYRQAELRDVVERDVLSVVAADDNPRDPNAVEVRTADGTLLGFVPAALAPRLRATGTGPWPAVVDAVLRKQTWGLRITVYPAGTPEADLAPTTDETEPAHRQPPAARTEATAGTPPATGGGTRPAPATPVAARSIVKAPSGRILGELDHIEGSQVWVTNDGRKIAYPASVVQIERHAAA